MKLTDHEQIIIDHFKGDIRRRFCVIPRRMWKVNKDGYIETCGWAWFKFIIEVRTLFGDWKAYNDHQTIGLLNVIKGNGK